MKSYVCKSYKDQLNLIPNHLFSKLYRLRKNGIVTSITKKEVHRYRHRAETVYVVRKCCEPFEPHKIMSFIMDNIAFIKRASKGIFRCFSILAPNWARIDQAAWLRVRKLNFWIFARLLQFLCLTSRKMFQWASTQILKEIFSLRHRYIMETV